MNNQLDMKIKAAQKRIDDLKKKQKEAPRFIMPAKPTYINFVVDLNGKPN